MTDHTISFITVEVEVQTVAGLTSVFHQAYSVMGVAKDVLLANKRINTVYPTPPEPELSLSLTPIQVKYLLNALGLNPDETMKQAWAVLTEITENQLAVLEFPDSTDDH